ncbi:DUF2695 domain-containing protein [Aporhodopirellula aestuarii]|uniref:DUF2695 domain-containing protein n=1 Tax=Aporhodopirellula aestuarii TaxID=2950107 RepID=A0ABT0U2B0_9BACT|nr:DUF2695 domain-containing protein [Aporhodopirellula aestuarii]MCM2371007.1 DUF2695 domain-containing protein [Aporhodopirellula aestuarii]
MSRKAEQIVDDLRDFIVPSYPDIEIRVRPWEEDERRLAIYFTDTKFASLYPYQRWHYLTHLIPSEYQEQYLETTVWFELAPGESPADLSYPDEELISDITPDVMRILKAIGFFRKLDDIMCPHKKTAERGRCWGDFRNSRPLLLSSGITESELFDVFHVLMLQGGFCDCEILYNAVEESRLKAEYWTARAEGIEPHDPHRKT